MSHARILSVLLLLLAVTPLWSQPTGPGVQCADPSAVVTRSHCGPGVEPRLVSVDLVQSQQIIFPVGVFQAIPADDPVGVISELIIPTPEAGPIEDLDVAVEITHTFTGDLTITLLSPSGTEVTLLTSVPDGGDYEDINVGFDDEGVPFDRSQLADGLAMQLDPAGGGSLSEFDGETHIGPVDGWVMTVVDDVVADTGTFQTWFLFVTTTCGVPFGDSGPVVGGDDFIIIGNTGPVEDVDVGVDINCTFVGDLTVTLEHDLTFVTLLANEGDFADDVNVTFDDEGVPFDAALLTSGLSMQTDPTPGNLLSNFDGMEKQGLWSLTVTDSLPGSQDGFLEGWSIRIEDLTPGLPVYSDAGPTVNAVTVDEGGDEILDVDVSVEITGSWIEEIEIDVIAPSGTVVRLKEGEETLEDFTDVLVTFDDEGAPHAPPWNTGGRMQPAGPPFLVSFDGQSPLGTWAISVTDNGLSNSTELLQWCVEITSEETDIEFTGPTVDTLHVEDYGIIQDADVFVDIATAFTEDLGVAVSSPAGVTVGLHEYDSSSTDDILMTFDDEGIPNLEPYDQNVNMQPAGIGALSDFDDQDKNGEWVLTIDDNFIGDLNILRQWCLALEEEPVLVVASDPGPTVTETASPGSVISAAVPLTTDTIASAPTPSMSLMVCDLDVMVDISHTFIGDLEIDLESPALTTVRLFKDLGNTSADILTTFDDEGVAFGSAPFDAGASMQPRGPGRLSDFDGENAFGAWTLSIFDGFQPDDGVLNSWSLIHAIGLPFEGDGVPAVASVTVTDANEIEDVNVGVCITETFVGDATVQLTAPSGTMISLHDGQGGANTHLRVTWDDEGLPNGSAPFSSGAIMQPAPGTLSALDGENTQGDWTLNVFDTTEDPGVDGYLQGFQLQLAGDTPYCAGLFLEEMVVGPGTGPAPLTIDVSSIVTGTGPITYLWDFDDGTTSSDPATTHTYTDPGTYDVTLTVTNACSSQSDTIPVNVTCEPLSASFVSDPPAGEPPLVVDFMSTVTGTGPFTYSWDFGDGSPASTAENPSHTYAVDGTFTVSLLVMDTCGATTTTTGTVTVECAPLIASFSPDLTMGGSPLTVSFTNASTGTGPLTYAWSFGDGATSVAESPSHTYTTPGSNTVNLEVTDFCGNSATASTVIVVEAAPTTFIRGDADGNGAFSGLIDGLFMLSFQFVPGSPMPPCMEAADANGDGAFSGILDGLFALNCQFDPTAPCPPAPYPACGADSDPGSSLGCLAPPSCP